jgi:hypothetical protein
VPSSAGYAFQTPGGPEELEIQRGGCSAAEWDQEWDCKPRANKNAVFNAFELDEIATARNPRIEIEQGPERREGAYLTAVDIGGTVDHTKLVVGHSSGDIVFAKAFPLGQHDKQQAHDVMEVAHAFRSKVIVDSTGGGAGQGQSTAHDSRMAFYRQAAQLLHLDCREFFWTNKNKERMISNLRVAVQEKQIGIAADLVDVVKELKSYEYKYIARNASYVYSAPAGKADDYVQATAIFVEALNRSWIRRGNTGALAQLTY